MTSRLSLLIALPFAFAAAVLAQTEPKPIAVHEHEVDGVDVALMDVRRVTSDTVTVKWEYRNKTKVSQALATKSTGWGDPYRLSWSTYLADEEGKVKFPLLRDSEGRPIAAVHGTPVHDITVGPLKTLRTWAKYQVSADVKNVTVFLTGVEPFENVAIGEPALPPNGVQGAQPPDGKTGIIPPDGKQGVLPPDGIKPPKR